MAPYRAANPRSLRALALFANSYGETTAGRSLNSDVAPDGIEAENGKRPKG